MWHELQSAALHQMDFREIMEAILSPAWRLLHGLSWPAVHCGLRWRILEK